MKSPGYKIALILFIFLSANAFSQQNLPQLRTSPRARVEQNVGFANIAIEYGRPGVKERDIWGKLVPFGLAPNAFGNGKPMPWRAGADENTTLKLSHDAQVNGHPLAAGTYGIHMIVQENEWTVIFSKDHNAWGSFFYDEKNDALRVQVAPKESEFQEWLVYGFDNLTANSCDAFLHWGKLKVPFQITFDMHKIVLETYRDQLTNAPGFNQAAWATAARYCLNNRINLDEAMIWIEKALSLNGGDNFTNRSIQAGLLTATGKSAEGEKLLETSMEKATEAELNNYGYQLINQKQLDKAIEVFKRNVKKFPKSWNVYDSLGEALAAKGDKSDARKNYQKAFDLAPANQKSRIEGILKGL